MNRRDVLRAIALGGGLIAGELWIPGQSLVSIPKSILLSKHRYVMDRWTETQVLARDDGVYYLVIRGDNGKEYRINHGDVFKGPPIASAFDIDLHKQLRV
jgi:hypothetical protein